MQQTQTILIDNSELYLKGCEALYKLRTFRSITVGKIETVKTVRFLLANIFHLFLTSTQRVATCNAQDE